MSRSCVGVVQAGVSAIDVCVENCRNTKQSVERGDMLDINARVTERKKAETGGTERQRER